MRQLTANIGGARWVPELREVIAQRGPKVVVVTEAYHARRFLRSIGGYRLFQYRRWHGAEAPNVAILVRDGAQVSHRQLHKMHETWRFNGGRLRRPRRYPSMDVDDVGVFGFHNVPHGPTGANHDAWDESWQYVAAWLRRDQPRSAPGDYNARAGELAARLGKRLQLIVGTKVDHNITHGLRHKSTERLHRIQPEGMHGWVLYNVTR